MSPKHDRPDPWEVPTIIATIVVCGGATLGLALAKFMGWVS